ncbi:substrate-binding periplasmic protein [Rheinheimera maricola]|uniref:Transporter substrate-binding domain-containing protein n=1 Tax=Rheinheimera maricola TaxID=2793282 RepID=A0ABS7XCR5_9GAMM|nr:transporter substrate-binding domain-containing protein [Rheinheimera maricola]MBZ9613344.1 transporter substrate-binding domain-containing protein [Rheinheimera maricola]
MSLKHVSMLVFVVTALFVHTAAAQQRQEVLLLTYHLKAPFIVDLGTQQGLYFELAHYLNQRSTKYWYKTEFVPRKRLDAMLQRPFPHVVVGVQPVWFKQLGDRMRFSKPILRDSDVFISLKKNAVSDVSPVGLKGKTLLGVQGYRYVGIEQALNNGNLMRVDTLQEEHVLDMLRLGRGDFAIISLSTLNYIFLQGEDKTQFYIADEPHESINRSLMFSSADLELQHELHELVVTMPNDPEWLALLAKYNLDQHFLPAF